MVPAIWPISSHSPLASLVVDNAPITRFGTWVMSVVPSIGVYRVTGCPATVTPCKYTGVVPSRQNTRPPTLGGATGRARLTRRCGAVVD